MRWKPVAVLACITVLLCPFLNCQTTAQTPPMPRDYRGVAVHIDGVFVTPVPNAPFVATVQIVSHNKLPDGTEHVVTTTNHIARSSSGRIHNERRMLVPASYKGEPRLLSAHIYDPSTRQNIFTDPMTRIARETILPAPERTPANLLPPGQQRVPPGVTVTSLGTQTQDGVELQGTRKTRILPADASGTGQPVTITDDYWYSPDLSIYLIIRHDDPRTGEQIVAVSHIERIEPPAELLSVPDGYKLVDETPPPPPPPTVAPAR
jgi:hypothetical protein